MLQEHLMMALLVEVANLRPNLLDNQCNGVIPSVSQTLKELVPGEVQESAQCSHCIILTYKKSLENLLTLEHQVTFTSYKSFSVRVV